MTMNGKIKSSIDFFKHIKKLRGEISKWSDNLLLHVRDKMRRIGRSNGGKWTIDFYEALQVANKESQKRKLTQYTP